MLAKPDVAINPSHQKLRPVWNYDRVSNGGEAFVGAVEPNFRLPQQQMLLPSVCGYPITRGGVMGYFFRGGLRTQKWIRI